MPEFAVPFRSIHFNKFIKRVILGSDIIKKPNTKTNTKVGGDGGGSGASDNATLFKLHCFSDINKT